MAVQRAMCYVFMILGSENNSGGLFGPLKQPGENESQSLSGKGGNCILRRTGIRDKNTYLFSRDQVRLL